MKKIIYTSILASIICSACSVSYSFRGTSIDYTKVQTIEIREFTNQDPRLPYTAVIEFNNHLKDIYTRNTKLSFVDTGGDLELEGEITRVDFATLSLKEDALGSETRLTVSVAIRFRDNTNPDKDKTETISAYRDFDSDKNFDEVLREGFMDEIVKEIVDQIFNTTLSDW